MKIKYNKNLTAEQNRQNAIAAVTENGANLLDVDQRYCDDEDVVTAALSNNGSFDKVSERLKRQQNIALIAVQNNPYAFKNHVIALFKNYLELRGIDNKEFKKITKNKKTISQNQHFQTFLQGPDGANKDNLLAVQLAAIEAVRVGQSCIVKTQGDYMVDFKEMESQSYRSRVAKIAFNQDLGNQRSEIFSEATKKLVLESYSYDRRFGGALLQLCVDGVVNYVHYNQALDNGRIPLTVDNFGAGVAAVGTCNDPRNPSHLTVALNNNAALIYKFIPEDEQGKIGCVKPFYSNNGIEIEITKDQSRTFLPKIVDNERGHIVDQAIINAILTQQQPNALAQPIVNNLEQQIPDDLNLNELFDHELEQQQMRVDEPQIRKQVKREDNDEISENPGTGVGSPKVYQMIDKSQNQRDL